MDEDKEAASALADLLTSAMTRAIDERRDFLYGWERRGLQWLIRFRERDKEHPICAWCSSFMRLNRDVIMAEGGRLDFNLRAARLAEEARST